MVLQGKGEEMLGQQKQRMSTQPSFAIYEAHPHT